jgi:protein gp37
VNKTKIEWCDYTWNPITGCLNGCSYCYARRIYQRFKKSFKPKFHYERLSHPLKVDKPSRIFVCSVSDFWGRGVYPIWRDEVYNVIRACPQHTFLFLTKQPQRIRDDKRIPENCWVGVSVSTNRDWGRPAKLCTKDIDNRFISIEPLIEKDDHVTSYFFLAKWIIVGAMTGAGNKKYSPNPKAIKYILDIAKRCKIPVFMKNNLKPHWSGRLIQQYPEG